MNTIELKLNRRTTVDFINAAPIDVVLHRPHTTRASNPRGGITTDDGNDEELPSQRFRILHTPPRRRRAENSPPNASIGEIPFAKDNLMCRWDADVKIGDWFEWNGARYTITYVFVDNTYEIICNLANTDQ
jgi:hypothetical protein